MNIPVITLSGGAFEKGFLHGRRMKAQVMVSLETYRYRYFTQKHISWEEARNIASRFAGVFQGEYLKYYEEMRGIAEGAGLDIEDILALNLRSEILYSGLVNLPQAPDECTAFSALPPATADNQVFAGQSWDFNIAQRDASFIAKIPAEGAKPAILMFMEGGMVGGKGVNDAGMCVTLNALNTPNAAIGMPLHVRMRSALECGYLGEAFHKLALTPIPVPANLILTHKDGLSFAIELDPAGADIIQGENGVLAHTNHYIGAKNYLSHKHSEYGSTYIRLQRMNYLLRSKPKLEMADFEGFLKDHAGYPSSICAHASPNTPPEKLKYEGATNYAFIANLKSGLIRFVMGNPCEGEFEDIYI